MRRAHGGFQALVLGGVVACGGNIDVSSRAQRDGSSPGHVDASTSEPADASAPDPAPGDGSSSCQALGEGVELVAVGLRNVAAIDANLSSITLTVNSYPKNPAESQLVRISKSTCNRLVLAASPDPITDITATDRLVIWSQAGPVLSAEAPAWSATPLDVQGLLGVKDQVYANPLQNDHDDVPIALLGIETTPYRMLASMNPDRIDVLADLTGLQCEVRDVARNGESFLLAGGMSVLDVGPRGCVAVASSTGAPRLIFKTDQFVPRQIVAHAGLAYFPTGDTILRLDPASGATAVFAAAPADVIAGDPTGMYWAGAGRVELTPWSGGSSRALAPASRQATFIAVDDKHVYWLEIGDDQGALGESYNLMRVAK